MARHVCPWWIGYFLLNPLRRLRESPTRLLGPYVRAGMTVLEPGCGMGYFTIDLARLVGPRGRVVAVDVQERMLAGLRRRAARAAVLERLDIRTAGPDGLGIGDLAGRVDLAAVLHMAHEVPDADAFFAELAAALRPGGRVIVVEPRGHVSQEAFAATLAAAARQGLAPDGTSAPVTGLAAVLRRPAPDEGEDGD